MILGIDEVGRGPWAGPLVIGAVVLPDGCEIEGLTDSKKLSEKRRDALDVLIKERALGWGLGWVYPEELDEVGLSQALRLATIRAVEAVKAPYHQIIIDGTVNFLRDTNKGGYVTMLPKADALIPAVSAASIIAKVARDTYMKEQARLYPAYGFESHVGYGTAQHKKALAEHGVTPLHRTSFAPIRALLKTQEPTVQIVSKHSTSAKGASAERHVAEYLTTQGFYVAARNWRTKWCEIDLIAEKDKKRYFVEVKYRKNAQYGDGLEAITPKKQQQMAFAAELYQASAPDEKQPVLMAASVDLAGGVRLLELE